jgi:hypothetical protein
MPSGRDPLLLSAEMRWFWKDSAPRGLSEWFHDESIHGCGPGGGPPPRVDVYVIGDASGELGIKVRGTKGKGMGEIGPTPQSDVEVKGLVAFDETGSQARPFAGPIEVWCKWAFPQMDIGVAQTCWVMKTRWVRKFDARGLVPVEIPLGPDEWPLNGLSRQDLPVRGCNVELTEVHLEDGERWATLCLESFGELGTVKDDLRVVAASLAGRGPLPDLGGGQLLSYPRWLALRAASRPPRDSP